MAVFVPVFAGGDVVVVELPDDGGALVPVPDSPVPFDGGPVATGVDVEPEGADAEGKANELGAAAVWKLRTAATPATVAPTTIGARFMPPSARSQKANVSR